MTIPKFIHQIMHNFSEDYPPTEDIVTPVPEKWEISPKEWKRLHPTWSYILWNGYRSRELIRIHYSDFLDIYDNMKYPIQRCDMVRYFILYHYGGVYSDLDLYPTKPIAEYVSNNVEAYFVYGDMSIANSFIGSSYRAPFWLKVHKALKENSLSCFTKMSKHFHIMMSTGPMFLNKVVKNYSDATLGRLPRGFYNHEIFEEDGEVILKSIEGMSWCGWDSHALNFLNKHMKPLAIIGVIAIFIVIILFIYFIYKSIVLRKSLNKCRASKSKNSKLKA